MFPSKEIFFMKNNPAGWQRICLFRRTNSTKLRVNGLHNNSIWSFTCKNTTVERFLCSKVEAMIVGKESYSSCTHGVELFGCFYDGFCLEVRAMIIRGCLKDRMFTSEQQGSLEEVLVCTCGTGGNVVKFVAA